uniref:Aminotransferase-like plant mobile domain-containing protein n=1 Tax=Fagus sylvatica TaxID=28930 RepID=A0A2N9F949_FAGSY
MVKFSSNTDPCGRAIQIIEALPAAQHITDVLIPRESIQSSSSSASTSPRFGLGPSFLSFPEDLSPIFPCHSHFASSYQKRQMKWGEWDIFSTSVTWYKASNSWFSWVARLAITKLEKWKMLGINEAIRASKYDIPINPSLLISLLSFCSLVINTFSFLKRYMTLTVANVFALMCLLPMGAFAHNLMVVGKSPDEDILNGMPLNYSDFVKEMKANGAPVDLSSFVLGELYQAMFLLSTEPKQSHGGLVWLRKVWAYSYFPSITPELHPTIVPWSYGEAWMHARYPEKVPSYPTCFKLFNDASKRTSPEDFMPFEVKKYGSKDFQKFSSQGFFRGDSAWGACLQSRDLVVIRFTNAVIDRVTAYNSELAEVAFDLRNQLMRLPTSSEQGTHILTKRKTPKVEKVDPAASVKGAKPSGKKLIKIVAKKSTTKKPKVVEVTPETPIIEFEPLDEELDDTTTLFVLIRETRAEEAERKRLEVEVEESRKAEKAEERIAEIERRLEIKKKEKAEVEQKKQQELKKRKKEKEEKEKKKKEKEEKEEVERKEKEKKEEAKAASRKVEHQRAQVVPGEGKVTKQAGEIAAMPSQKVTQPVIEVETLIEAATSSIEATTPLAQNMPEGLGDIDKLLEDVSLTLQQYQTPTKTSSILTPLEPTRDQLQATVDQLKDFLQKPAGVVLLDASLVDQFQ